MPSGNGLRRDLVGNYTIPSQLKDDILNEEMRDSDLLEKDLRQGFKKNEYQEKGLRRLADMSRNHANSYFDRMSQMELEKEEEKVAKLIDEKERDSKKNKNVSEDGTYRTSRKRRWDVTPEEKERSMMLEIGDNNKRNKLEQKAQLVSRQTVPVVNGIALSNDVLEKILPSGYLIVYPSYRKEQYLASLKEESIIYDQNFYVPPTEGEASLETKRILSQGLSKNADELQGLSFIKENDIKHFGPLILQSEDEFKDFPEKEKELKVMKLLLKVKNGVGPTRKKSIRHISENAISYGPGLVFDKILPLLLEPNIDELERTALVKLIGRILYRIDNLVRPYTHKILLAVSHLLIDEDFMTRLEAREIISNLSKAAGLANMISNMRPDLDHSDEYVRNLCSRVFAIVANTLGLVNFLPFLKAVIKSKKSWMVRHTGIKVIQQLCILLGGGHGNSILPYLDQLTSLLKGSLTDNTLQVRTIAAMTLAQLAENVKPYGVESFNPVLEPAWLGLKNHRGRPLAAFLNCIGSIIPLMCYDQNYEEYANYYSKELMRVITREFNSPDDEMRRTILRIMINLPLSGKLIKDYEATVVRPFLKVFWTRKVASDSLQLTKLVVEATTLLGKKFDFLEMLENIVFFAKDDNELLRLMSLETINKMITLYPDQLLGMDSQSEYRLVDSILYAFQEQGIQHRIYLQVFGTVSKALNIRISPHIPSIVSTILYRLKHKTPEVRQQASDLISLIVAVIKQCSGKDDELLIKLILVLYESLGEVYPEVLGSLLNAMHACMENADQESLYSMSSPSINQLLPTLTPILKNRHDKVQESCIKLVGLIALKNAETINAKEWLRICFELLDMLKSPKKRIRIAAIDTFGRISLTIGPQDVLVMLLNNLRVQERQLRVCTAVAIGIVAEICEPFTVLPALLNEYRTPENNVQNGVLKALCFMFETIDGQMSKDYLFAITPLLKDGLTERDQVHRQTAASTIRHLALNCVGLANDDYYDVFLHFLNLLLPNIFETSPHVINRILESIDAIRLVIGNGSYSNHIWAGLFHSAKKVRNPYWKIFNAAYVHCCDALVPYYPDFNHLNEYVHDYSIEELELRL